MMIGTSFARSYYLLSQRSSAAAASISSSSYFIRNFFFSRPFSSSSSNTASSTTITNRSSKLVNFSPPSTTDSDDDDEDNNDINKLSSPTTPKTQLPPPYDPFNKKKPTAPEDPKNLPEVFHKMSSEGGLFNNAVKMFDALSKDGLTHEALELFSQIKDKGHMPDVVSHTAILGAYADAGQAKEAHRTYLRMLASGVAPNAYTYSVLIKSLSGSGDKKLMKEATKCMKEMIGKGMRPNAGTWVAVFERYAREEERVEEGRELLEEIKAAGFEPDEKAIRQVLRERRGPVPRKLMDILFPGTSASAKITTTTSTTNYNNNNN